jgi:hypothetical protein
MSDSLMKNDGMTRKNRLHQITNPPVQLRRSLPVPRGLLRLRALRLRLAAEIRPRARQLEFEFGK